jgi:glycosyltransferase involved in cell wall biosynthesis
LTPSTATAQRVERYLGVRPRAVIAYPLDLNRGTRMRDLRVRSTTPSKSSPRCGPLLYVGRVRPHKNLVRAVRGFARSGFAKGGGRFVIAGVDAVGRHQLEEVLGEPGTGGVAVLGRQTEAELDRLYAEAGFVIQPSLEEGYGLGVAEALAAGIPVCCSAVSPLMEIADGRCELFDPASVEAIRSAIDRTAQLANTRFVPPWPQGPTPGQFADEIVGHIDALLENG